MTGNDEILKPKSEGSLHIPELAYGYYFLYVSLAPTVKIGYFFFS